MSNISATAPFSSSTSPTFVVYSTAGTAGVGDGISLSASIMSVNDSNKLAIVKQILYSLPLVIIVYVYERFDPSMVSIVVSEKFKCQKIKAQSRITCQYLIMNRLSHRLSFYWQGWFSAIAGLYAIFIIQLINFQISVYCIILYQVGENIATHWKKGEHWSLKAGLAGEKHGAMASDNVRMDNFQKDLSNKTFRNIENRIEMWCAMEQTIWLDKCIA